MIGCNHTDTQTRAHTHVFSNASEPRELTERTWQCSYLPHIAVWLTALPGSTVIRGKKTFHISVSPTALRRAGQQGPTLAPSFLCAELFVSVPLFSVVLLSGDVSHRFNVRCSLTVLNKSFFVCLEGTEPMFPLSTTTITAAYTHTRRHWIRDVCVFGRQQQQGLSVCAGDIRGIQAWAAAGCRDILPHPSSPPRLPDAHLHFPRAQIAGLTHDGGMSLTLRALPIDVHVCSWVTAWMSRDNNMWSQPSFLRLRQQGWQSDDWHKETKAPGKKGKTWHNLGEQSVCPCVQRQCNWSLAEGFFKGSWLI